jgi:hypothetical protein
MKNWLTISVLFLASLACAQTVIITGTVLDPNGIPYQGGSGRAVLTPGNVQWLVNNTNPVPTPITISGIDSFGHFSISLTNTSLIAPASMNPQWTFSFCSQTYAVQAQPVCFTMTPMSLITSQDISTQIQAQAAPLPSIGGSSTGATPNGGLAVTGSNLGLLKTCSNGQVLSFNGTAWVCATVSGSGFSITSFTGGSTVEIGATVTNPTFTASYNSTPTSASITNTDNIDSPLVLTSPFTSGPVVGSFVQTTLTATTFTLTAIASSTQTAAQAISWIPRSFGGVGNPGATSSVSASGNTAILSTSDVLANAGLASSDVGATYGPYTATSQNVYLLLIGGSHTFKDPGTGFPFAFNAPTSVSFVNQNMVTVPMYLYQSTNTLTGNYSVLVVN